MSNLKSVSCFWCKSVILNLTISEIKQMNGLHFQCECCGHQNLLSEMRFHKSRNNDPSLYIYSIDNLL